MVLFSKDLGIDLGTSNVLIYAAGKGIVLREPAVIALDKNTGKVLQVGAAARNMLGRTPGNVVAIHPLKNGVISDYELTAKMLTEMIRKVVKYAVVKETETVETYGVSFEGFEPSCGWPSYNSWTEKIIPREKSELVRWGKILEDRQKGLTTIKDAQSELAAVKNGCQKLLARFAQQEASEERAIIRQVNEKLKQSTRKVTPPAV